MSDAGQAWNALGIIIVAVPVATFLGYWFTRLLDVVLRRWVEK